MPTAYFITFTTYGSRLHGDARGTVDAEHNAPGAPHVPTNPHRVAANRAIMAEAACLLEPSHRELVREAIASLAESQTPELVASQYKSWATRRLRESNSIGDRERVWAKMASTRCLNTDAGHAAAIDYVKRFQ